MDFSKFTGQKFDAIKFVMAENLSTDLWNQSEKKKGLVLVATKVNSVPRDIVIPLDMNPVDFIKKLSIFEDVKQDQLDLLIKQLRESEVEVGEVA